jgi:hypothetical protein
MNEVNYGFVVEAKAPIRRLAHVYRWLFSLTGLATNGASPGRHGQSAPSEKPSR